MAFPTSPTNGQTYTTNNVTYVYDSTLGVWNVQGSVSTASGVTSVAGRTGTVTLSATDVGLGNVTNESKATMFSGPTFTGTTTMGTVSAGAVSVSSLSASGAISGASLSITAGIQNTPIGSSTANSGAFTTLAASGAVSFTSTASITGRITKSVSGGVATGGSGRFVVGTGTQMDMHISSSSGGSNPTTCQQYGISFTNGGGATQAAIVCSENGNDGTAIGFLCTDSYAAGPKLQGYILPWGSTYFSGGLGLGTAPSSTSGQILATNSITAFYSDGRLKTKVGNIENALDKIDQLSGFLYVHNDLARSYGYTDDDVYVGVDANAVKKVQPEATKLAPFDRAEDGTSKSGENYLTVQYEKLVPLLVEGIKELRQELNSIKRQLK